MATSATPKKLHKKLMNELALMRADPTPGLTLRQNQEDDLKNWIVEIRGAAGTEYEEQLFKLKFEFNGDYPFKPPHLPVPRQA